MLNESELQTLVNEIIEFGNKLRSYHEVKDTNAKTLPAPKKTLIDTFKNHYSFKLPPSYIRLLSIWNGIENLEWTDVSILSMEFLIEHDNLEDFWIDIDACSEGELFIFAKSFAEPDIVAFLRKTARDDGEMDVIHLDSGGVLDQYNNFEQYLLDRRDWFAEYVAKEEADREGLSEDD